MFVCVYTCVLTCTRVSVFRVTLGQIVFDCWLVVINRLSSLQYECIKRFNTTQSNFERVALERLEVLHSKEGRRTYVLRTYTAILQPETVDDQDGDPI